MLLKWIVCQVPDSARASFEQSQKGWGALSQIDGFIGQVGGWNLKAHTQACVLAIWRDLAAYQAFMDREHDNIVGANRQYATYESIEVSLLEPVYPMPGESAALTDCIRSAVVVRVADCLVRKAQLEHFLTVQKEIWIPGMASASGMLGGCFSKVAGEDHRYIVTTMWSSLKAHQNYGREIFPDLQKRASVSDDVSQITGSLVVLNEHWRVVATIG